MYVPAILIGSDNANPIHIYTQSYTRIDIHTYTFMYIYKQINNDIHISMYV
jgi:hypothetical protein